MKMIMVVLASVMMCAHAHAYLDSGSGSMLVQLLLGGLVGAGAFIKFYWHKIADLFKKKKK